MPRRRRKASPDERGVRPFDPVADGVAAQSAGPAKRYCVERGWAMRQPAEINGLGRTVRLSAAAAVGPRRPPSICCNGELG